MIDIIHITCGDIAFRTHDRPATGDIMDPSDVVLLAGIVPKVGSHIICGSCGEQCTPASLRPDGGFA
jgi:hypothetical protein